MTTQTRNRLLELILSATAAQTGELAVLSVTGGVVDNTDPLNPVINVEEEFGWADNIQAFSASKGNGTTEPVWRDMGNGMYGYHFTAADELFVFHHVNHDYKQGTNAYPHIHFLVDQVMNVGEQVTWKICYVLAKGHQQGQSLTAPTTEFNMTYTATGTEVAGEHIILECSDLQAFDLIEPDTLIIVCATLVSENVSGRVFGILHDLHYQTDRHATLNKAPNFYS
jgi:hypothetical protein